MVLIIPSRPSSLASSIEPILELDVRESRPADALELDGRGDVRLGFFRKEPPTLITPRLPPTSPSATYTTLSSLISSRSTSFSSDPELLNRCKYEGGGVVPGPAFVHGDENVGGLCAVGKQMGEVNTM